MADSQYRRDGSPKFGAQIKDFWARNSNDLRNMWRGSGGNSGVIRSNAQAWKDMWSR